MRKKESFDEHGYRQPIAADGIIRPVRPIKTPIVVDAVTDSMSQALTIGLELIKTMMTAYIEWYYADAIARE